MFYESRIPIKQWSEDDRPREKLLLKGKSALSNAELIALLLGSGNRNESAVDLAKRVLDKSGQNLAELSRFQISDLIKIKGIGQAKGLTIIAALELGNRKRSQDALSREKVAGSHDVYELFHGELADAQYESFWVLLLNRANRVIRKVNISEGGISGTVADPKKIFKMSLEHNASSLILCHNHPSGNTQPSEADIRLTRKLKEAGLLLDLPVLDHLIVGADSYFSFADEGML
ncbi:MAG: DNA repair protein RadC [Bacteroidales bacterium]|jgi:DNA repair protein RadC|nr:DNA repair protein RadC [Bacteroidales bacterium]